MKRDRINSIFGGLLVATSLLTTACATNDLFEGAQADNGGKETITLTVTPQTIDMRGSSIPPSNYSISDGKKANVLIYAIYKQEGGKWIICTEDDVVEEDESTTIEGIEPGNGQKIIDWSDSQESKLTLTIDKNTNYKLAFWAQSSKCKAYTTTNLEKVEVSYDNAKNNDEYRDAFCASLEIIGKIAQNNYTVTLKRPFAQINVGTTGADYKHLMTSSKVYPNKTITQSKIVLTGVSKFYNVLEGKTVDDDKNNITATFGFDVIPAYMDIPLPIEEAEYYKGTVDTQFLEVDLDKKDGIAPYRYSYPTIKKTEIEGEEGEEKKYSIEYLTETFKYLSMCYVLVPTTSNQSDNSTLSSVKVYFAEEKDKNSSGEVESDYMTVSLTQVPVRRNWRTNILGGLYEGGDSDDPEDPGDDPEDPTSIFNLISVTVSINPAFYDEYTTDYGSGVWIFPNTSTEEEPEEQPVPQD